jgi:hypothetical protein
MYTLTDDSVDGKGVPCTEIFGVLPSFCVGNKSRWTKRALAREQSESADDHVVDRALGNYMYIHI